MTPVEKMSDGFLRWYYYFAVFSATVLFRLICLNDFINSPFFVPIGGDRALYHNLAVSVFHGEWFGNVFSFLPLYPIFLGFLYKVIGGPNLAAAAVCQAVLDGLTAGLIVFIACKYYGKKSAIAAGAGFALLGISASYSLVTMPVSLGMLWTALTAALTARWQDNWNYLRAAGMGLVLGLGGQILGSFWLMIIPFAAWIALTTSKSGLVPKFSIGLIVIFSALTWLLPTLGHNYSIEKRIVPISAHFGLNVYMGNNPYCTGYGHALPGLRTSAEEMTADSVQLASELARRPMTAAAANRFWIRQALSFWVQNPKKALALLFHKFHKEVSIRDFDDIGLSRILPREIKPLRIAFVNFGLIWILACLGFMALPRSPGNKTFSWIMGACIAGGMLVTFVTARYRLPLAVLLLPAAGNAVIMIPRIVKELFLIKHIKPKLSRFLPGLAGIVISILPHGMPATKFTDDLNKSIYLTQAGKIMEAFSYAQNACTQCANSPDAWLALGNIYFIRGDYTSAFQSYERMLGIQGNRVDALFNAGMTLEQMNRKQEACNYYKKVVEIDPRHAKAWLGLALIYRELRQEQDAREALEKAAEIVGRQHPQIVEFYRGNFIPDKTLRK